MTVTGTQLDDVTLVARARDGDAHSYEQLVTRYEGPIYRLALRMLANAADAEDVTQEAFLAAWRQLGQLQEDAAFVGWLYRSATNRCLNVIRSRKPLADSTPEEHAASGPDGKPEQQAETSAQLAALSTAMGRLTPEKRACWLLREVHGRSYDEIATTLGVSATTVRGRIARARAELAEVMSPWR
ncbi:MULTISPECIES: RNA polymerase sigma factor [Prauserella salsuginis group]|uniref:RNA polymerase sigma-70 factor (ECF subfamily) n=2 Tax=Prauserella salsuginis group TaxID=2893672 RepID=A0A839XQK0_9PSEU|nr:MULTISPECIES: sigma-70 family RNA polymerase sigma factor [Prauserella salsuginis group]MBB3663178.1 RNA polymerase sigma-70 factor (ECF subfamily) [Prauserella sediminis]MCR3720995.1 RNA polymerase sigma-70 factor, ECF subfamily [Prauserella flava]MCR3734924.1 RNA polymerase sigma-70 factor, ECF subfamily [Prauserella salsuginis]